jgi:hypothetical protein
MIDPAPAPDAPMPSSAAPAHAAGTSQVDTTGAVPNQAGAPTGNGSGAAPTSAGGPVAPPQPEAVLCGHCGRTASNGISCIGMCVADSGY